MRPDSHHLVWDEAVRIRLAEWRKVRGDRQADLVRYVAENGGPTVSQSTVSGWESGRIRRPPDSALPILLRYLGHNLDDPDAAARPLSEAERRSFEHLTGQFVYRDDRRAETENSRRLGALHDALVARLASGGSFGSKEHELLDRTIDLLGVFAPPGDGDDGG